MGTAAASTHAAREVCSVDASVWRRGKQAAAARDEAARALDRGRFEVRREVVAAHYALRTAETQLEQAVAVSAVAALTRVERLASG